MSLSINERLDFFETNYDPIATYHLDKGGKLYIGNDDKKCRFCGETEPNVTFSNVAHAVPEFLGNKQLILKNECDTCNTFVSENLENDLDKYTKPFRLAAQIKGKKKVPSYKTKDKKSRFEFSSSEGAKIIDREDSKFANLDIENKSIETNFHLEPHRPSAVFKCLVKIALSVIDDVELSKFTNTISWLLEPDHSKTICKPQILLNAFIPGPKPNKAVTIIVLRRKAESVVAPYCHLVICFGNIAYQIVVPSDVDITNGTQTVKLYRFPLPFEDNRKYGNIKFGQEDLTNHEVVRDKMLPMSFSFDEAIKLDPSTVSL
ncbi:hypothetical protein EXT48_19110 [Pseudoalteromonas sp. CO348]|uniref:HNH endonuclease n=1 Tax=Pseudoalteromonas sp. CO348 TaxID=1777271 RepID=UPI001022DD84|nr:HNH endonuclease [Pseudoalteromonas sp. CO348]RZG00166.1 hypothetical protein EXT48_19110 [Pseudoalteromonas sp. CO348]